MKENTLYYGDNLDIMRRYINDESVDLVYLDPPFNSSQDYNVLFAEQDGSRSAAQIKAFSDTWVWDQEAERAYIETVEKGGKSSQALQGLRMFLGRSNMLAYLAMIAPRLIELRRVMKATASIYLHCDPTASHYLKLLMDAVFGAENYQNELIWKRTTAHSSAKRYGTVHDSILFYSLTSNFTWNQGYIPHTDTYLQSHYKSKDKDGRAFTLSDLTASGTRNGSSGQPWRGFVVSTKGNHWKFTIDKLEELDKNGLIYWPANGGWPRYKRYLDTVKGTKIQDIWSDIDPLNSQAQERLGYPTQKPESLLTRIINVSSNEGDVILDPFCGCGTTIAAAQNMNRRWVGIDITHIAISLIKTRLFSSYGEEIADQYTVVGEPAALPDAMVLAQQDRYQFQWWALGLVGARPAEQKKGADRGIDGRLYFHDGDATGKTKQVIFSVKSGHTDVKDVRDLGHVVQREGADIGVLITLHAPTKPMLTETTTLGLYTSPWGSVHSRLQVMTIAALLSGQRVDMPVIRGSNVTFKQAPKVATPARVVQATIALSHAEDLVDAAEADDDEPLTAEDADTTE